MKIRQDELLKQLRAIGAKKILLMVPDGLKPTVFDLFNLLSKEFGIIISSDPFFGACDVGTPDMYDKVDCIVQLGHSIIPNVRYPKPIIFVEHVEDRIPEISSVPFSLIGDHGFNRIGLLFSIQYAKIADKVQEHLEKIGYKVVRGRNDSRLQYPGQVLGCNYSTGHSVEAKVDCFLLVSTGKFHGLGAQLSLEKEVFLLDVNDLSLHSLKEETVKHIRRRYAAISRAGNARKICIVVDTKIGQKRGRLADQLLMQAQGLGLEAVIVHSNNASPMDYENMRCDAVVFTGCPRVAIDDQERYPMPILTAPEFQAAFAIKRQRRYVMDEIVAVD